MKTFLVYSELFIDKGGDYTCAAQSASILAVKANQGSLEEEVHATCQRNNPVSDTCTVEKGHGRIETRRCQVFEKGLIVDEERWKNLSTVVKITSTREMISTGKVTTQERYYTCASHEVQASAV